MNRAAATEAKAKENRADTEAALDAAGAVGAGADATNPVTAAVVMLDMFKAAACVFTTFTIAATSVVWKALAPDPEVAVVRALFTELAEAVGATEVTSELTLFKAEWPARRRTLWAMVSAPAPFPIVTTARDAAAQPFQSVASQTALMAAAAVPSAKAACIAGEASLILREISGMTKPICVMISVVPATVVVVVVLVFPTFVVAVVVVVVVVLG